MKIDSSHQIRPLDVSTWPAFEELFGPRQGANGGCWCMWWRLSRNAWQNHSKDERRASLKAIVQLREPTGILLFEKKIAIGWCAVSPHSALATFSRSRVSKPIDETPSWCISCFFVKAGHRNQGHMENLIKGAIWFAKKKGAPALDAFPQEMKGRDGYIDTFVGVATAFQSCGFKRVEMRGQNRSAIRLVLN
jgi:hypothetical protein